jgi:RNA ligase
MPKMDGSLGIMYDGDDFHRSIATRGSFHSEQAEWATEYIREFECDVRFYPSHAKTYLFEIIYPENRIVVDYGDYKGLMLIDVIDVKTGKSDLEEFDYCKWPDKAPRTILFQGFDSGHAADIPDGDEGFVYLWPEKNFRTKMKSAEYIELHKLISHLSEKSVWEQLVAGKTIEQIKAGIPDEFYGFIDKVATEIQMNAAKIVRTVNGYMRRYEDHGLTNSRKEFALMVKDNDYRKYLFAALDGKPIYPIALRDSKPVTNKGLVSTEDI